MAQWIRPVRASAPHLPMVNERKTGREREREGERERKREKAREQGEAEATALALEDSAVWVRPLFLAEKRDGEVAERERAAQRGKQR